MRFLSLFAGIGGFDLGLERAGMECMGQVELEPFCLGVLAKHWPRVKRIADIREVKGEEFGPVELICGGFPCQPFSTAGRRKGKGDNRYLWPEMLRVIEACRPRWVIGENVPGLLSIEAGMVFDTVCSDLECSGYEVWPLNIPACGVDAPHRRQRVWIVAYSQCAGLQGGEWSGATGEKREPGRHSSKRGEYVADPICKRRCGRNPKRQHAKNAREPSSCTRGNKERLGAWLPEPDVGRVAHGVPNRVDRLRALGNAVVPKVAEVIGLAIMQTEKLIDSKQSQLFS